MDEKYTELQGFRDNLCRSFASGKIEKKKNSLMKSKKLTSGLLWLVWQNSQDIVFLLTFSTVQNSNFPEIIFTPTT